MRWFEYVLTFSRGSWGVGGARYNAQPLKRWEEQMNEARRERLRGLIRMLKSARNQIEAVCLEEERAAEAGTMSKDAVDYLTSAATGIESAIESCKDAVGDDDAEP
jgi:hypothetical protein